MFVTLATLKYYFKSLDNQMKITIIVDRGIGTGKEMKTSPYFKSILHVNPGESPISVV